jgi:hypothetical protein
MALLKHSDVLTSGRSRRIRVLDLEEFVDSYVDKA